MPSIDSLLAQPLVHGAGMLILFIVIFLLARLAKYVSAGYDVHHELVDKDNIAVAVSLAGYYLGVVIIFVGAYLGPSQGLLADLVIVGGYTLLGVLLLNIARVINERFLLPHFSVSKELLEDRNVGVGAILMASYLSAALVVAGAIHGQGGGLLTALVFYAVGQIVLVVFTVIYDRTVPYSLHDELESGNVAAGIGFSGALIAIGLIVMNAVAGDFIGWVENGIDVAVQVSVIILYLIGVRFFFDKVMLPGAELNHEIARDRNIGAGVLEFAVSIGFSVVLIMIV